METRIWKSLTFRSYLKPWMRQDMITKRLNVDRRVKRENGFI